RRSSAWPTTGWSPTCSRRCPNWKKRCKTQQPAGEIVGRLFFTAGPLQGKKRPLGGQQAEGAAWGYFFTAGPLQGKKRPLGGWARSQDSPCGLSCAWRSQTACRPQGERHADGAACGVFFFHCVSSRARHWQRPCRFCVGVFMTYRVPTQDIRFVLKELADLPGVLELPGYEEFSPELIDAILDENARFVEQEVAPLNRVG